MLRAADVGAERPQAADEDGHLRRGEAEQVGAVDEQGLRLAASRRGAGSCGSRRPAARARANDSTSVCSWVASVRPGVERHRRPRRRRRARPSRPPREPASTIRSASETCAPPRGVELAWTPSSFASTVGELARVVDRPAALRLEADAGTVGAAALVGGAERRRRGPRRRDQLGDRRGRTSRTCALSAATSASPIEVAGRPPAPGPARAAARAPRGRGSASTGPMSRCSSLYQALAKASANSSGFSRKRREIFS